MKEQRALVYEFGVAAVDELAFHRSVPRPSTRQGRPEATEFDGIWARALALGGAALRALGGGLSDAGAEKLGHFTTRNRARVEEALKLFARLLSQ